MKKNKLVVIGFMGSMQCYLNVAREEAIQRFCKENQYLDVCVAEFEFDDQFGAYDVYANEDEALKFTCIKDLLG